MPTPKTRCPPTTPLSRRWPLIPRAAARTISWRTSTARTISLTIPASPAAPAIPSMWQARTGSYPPFTIWAPPPLSCWHIRRTPICRSPPATMTATAVTSWRSIASATTPPQNNGAAPARPTIRQIPTATWWTTRTAASTPTVTSSPRWPTARHGAALPTKALSKPLIIWTTKPISSTVTGRT